VLSQKIGLNMIDAPISVSQSSVRQTAAQAAILLVDVDGDIPDECSGGAVAGYGSRRSPRHTQHQRNREKNIGGRSTCGSD
jgi:hypothetical protein